MALTPVAGYRLEAELNRCSMDRRLSAPIDEAELNLIVWAKTNAGMGSLYRSQHELLPTAATLSLELRVGHFARRHGELAVLAACGMSSYRHIVGLVSQNELSLGFAIHKKT